MKVAMVAAGLPRFNSFFYDSINSIKGADSIDLYLYMWKEVDHFGNDSSIFKDGNLNFEEVYKNIPKNCTIKNLTITEEPIQKTYLPDKKYKQFYSLYMAYTSIKENYDCVIRFRVDARPDRDINLLHYDINSGIFTPKIEYPQPINDMFAIGNQVNMSKYFETINYITQSDKNILYEKSQEEIIYTNLINNEININICDFRYNLVTR